MRTTAFNPWGPLLLCASCALAASPPSDPPAQSPAPASALPELGGFYKHLLSATDLRENYQNLGLTREDIGLDDYQRFRLKCDYEPFPFLDFKLDWETRSAWGETTRVQNKIRHIGSTALPELDPLLSLDSRPRFLRLESDPVQNSNFALAQGLDRLQVRFQAEDAELSLGRQAVSWGPGLIWNPNDLFSGFAPTEIDRDEKLGVDVARFVWTPAFGTAVEMVAEPLDEDGPYRVDAEDSSLALRTTAHLGEFDLAALGGSIAGDQVLGADVTGYLKDAGVRGELIYTFVEESDERDYFRGLLSLDYAFQARWNPYVAVEYFYNGLGTADPDDYLSRLSADSVQRAFQRGNAFNLGRHYIGVAGSILPSALLRLQTTTICNLLDGSVRELASATWSISGNLDFQFGLDLGLGKLGTEFGGYSHDQIGVDFRHPNFAFGFLKYYF